MRMDVNCAVSMLPNKLIIQFPVIFLHIFCMFLGLLFCFRRYAHAFPISPAVFDDILLDLSALFLPPLFNFFPFEAQLV